MKYDHNDLSPKDVIKHAKFHVNNTRYTRQNFDEQKEQHKYYSDADGVLTDEEALKFLSINLDQVSETNLAVSVAKIAQGVYGIMKAQEKKLGIDDLDKIANEFSEVHKGMNEVVERMLKAEMELAKLKKNQEKILAKMDDLTELRERVRNFNLVEMK